MQILLFIVFECMFIVNNKVNILELFNKQINYMYYLVINVVSVKIEYIDKVYVWNQKWVEGLDFFYFLKNLN